MTSRQVCKLFSSGADASTICTAVNFSSTALGGQPWRQRACPLFERDLQALRHKGDKDRVFDAFIRLMIDQPNS